MKEINNCKKCGSDDYNIKLVYENNRQKLFIIECRNCRDYIIPVKIDPFFKEDDFYNKCLKSWNEHNT